MCAHMGSTLPFATPQTLLSTPWLLPPWLLPAPGVLAAARAKALGQLLLLLVAVPSTPLALAGTLTGQV